MMKNRWWQTINLCSVVTGKPDRYARFLFLLFATTMNCELPTREIQNAELKLHA
jgi:hypothetical protein